VPLITKQFQRVRPLMSVTVFWCSWSASIRSFRRPAHRPRTSASKRKSIGASHGGELALPITLGIVLDGIPESIVIGLGLVGGHTVSVAMLMAVFISNLPEAIAATTGLAAGGWSRSRIMRLWLIMALACGVASLAGFALLESASNATQAFINMFAGGAILVMLADTMMPEAFQHGGKLVGIITVMGFALAAYLSVVS
jgi:ZIP family zinc transporter